MRSDNLKKLSRQQKIEFLRGIKNGTRSILEFIPSVNEFFTLDEIIGVYTNDNTGHQYPINEFEKRKRPAFGSYRVVIFKSFTKKSL